MTNEEAIKAIKANYPSGEYKRLCKALDMAIEALENSRWIPVTERLPEEYKREYLVTWQFPSWSDLRRVRTAKYGPIDVFVRQTEDGDEYEEKVCWYDTSDDGEDYELKKIVAWMPKPKPYEGE